MTLVRWLRRRTAVVGALALWCGAVTPAVAGSYDDFVTAIYRDHSLTLMKLSQAGFDLNSLTPQLQPPLMLAIDKSATHVIEFLLNEPGYDIEARNPAGENALMLASIKGQEAVVERLLWRGAQVNRPGWTALHYAAAHPGPAAVPILRRLLEAHAYIDAASPNGTTPLMMAAQYGESDAAQWLVQEGADASLRNQKDLSAADFARRAGKDWLGQWLDQAAAGSAPRGR